MSTNRQERVLARVKKALDALSPKQKVAEQDRLYKLGAAGIVAEFGRKVPEANDLFESNARRAMQAERDAKLIAQPVASNPAGTGRLNLRTIEERLELRHDEGIPLADNTARKRRRRAKMAPAARRRGRAQYCRAGTGA